MVKLTFFAQNLDIRHIQLQEDPMKKLSVLSFVLFLTASLVNARTPKAQDYTGKWALVITNSNSTFRSCLLNLTESNGNLTGEMVWRWGSVWKIKQPGICTVDEKTGKLLVKRNGWKTPLELLRIGEMLEGKVELNNGTVFYLIGTPCPEQVAIEGTWDVVLTMGPDNTHKGGLIITDKGLGRISMTAFNDEGEAMDQLAFKKISLEGNKFTSMMEATNDYGDTTRMPFSLTFRGDALTGTVSTEDRQHSFTMKGSRRRKWGEPIKLLPENGMKGWKPRNMLLTEKRFHWECRDGVLTNKPGDVDIVSECMFQNFKLHLEYKLAKGSNSGVYLRGRYEAQILEDHGRGIDTHGNGAIYSRIPQTKNVSKPAGEWQTYEITLIGNYVTVVLNGVTTIDNKHIGGITGGAIDPFENQPGPLMLQGDHGKVWYRNITVQPALSD